MGRVMVVVGKAVYKDEVFSTSLEKPDRKERSKRRSRYDQMTLGDRKRKVTSRRRDHNKSGDEKQRETPVGTLQQEAGHTGHGELMWGGNTDSATFRAPDRGNKRSSTMREAGFPQ